MGKITTIIGGLLIALGLGFYFGTGMKSVTAMIPSFFGLPVTILGIIGAVGDRKARMITAHIVILLTLLGALGGFGMGIKGIVQEKAATSIAAQIIMGILCALHVFLSVRSFIAARKAREAAPEAPAETPEASPETAA